MLEHTDNERFWFLRNLAQGLVEYMGVVKPPVDLEMLLEYPPSLYQSIWSQTGEHKSFRDAIYSQPIFRKGKILFPEDLPEDERRFAIAREIIPIIGASEHGCGMGLPRFLMPDLFESQDFFARILLAPDALVYSFRAQGEGLDQFADTFIIPTRIAALRWEDPIAL